MSPEDNTIDERMRPKSLSPTTTHKNWRSEQLQVHRRCPATIGVLLLSNAINKQRIKEIERRETMSVISEGSDVNCGFKPISVSDSFSEFLSRRYSRRSSILSAIDPFFNGSLLFQCEDLNALFYCDQSLSTLLVRSTLTCVSLPNENLKSYSSFFLSFQPRSHGNESRNLLPHSMNSPVEALKR